jgi:hypothetical protein
MVAKDTFGLGEMFFQITSADEIVDIEEGVDGTGLVAYLHQCTIIAAARVITHARGHDVAERDLLAAKVSIDPFRCVFTIVAEISNNVCHAVLLGFNC